MRPVPELIMPVEWKKSSSKKKASVNLVDCEITVPFDGSVTSQLLRQHEYAHIRFSPRTVGKIEDKLLANCIFAFEDTRVNYLALKKGVDLRGIVTSMTEDEWKGRVYGASSRQWSILYASSLEYELPPYLKENFDIMIPIHIKSTIEVCHQQLRSEPTFDTVKVCAEVLAKLLHKEYGMSKTPNKSDSMPPITDLLEEVLTARSKDYNTEQAETTSGKMTIVHTPQSNYRRNPQVRTVRRLPSEDGLYFKHIHRELTDGLVFDSSRVYHHRIGTVLVDVSGSMKLNNERVKQIIELCSGVTVAVYSGHSDVGHLTIVAKGSRMVNLDSMYFPKGNIVDYHALRWLSKQRRRPLVWICDGAVTGIGDKTYDSITISCHRIVKQYNIRQVKSFQKFIEYATKIKKRLK